MVIKCDNCKNQDVCKWKHNVSSINEYIQDKLLEKTPVSYQIDCNKGRNK